MTARDRLRETCEFLGGSMPDTSTIDDSTVDGSVPLTYGDARKLDALVEAVGQLFSAADDRLAHPESPITAAAYRRADKAVRAAVAALRGGEKESS